MKRRVRQLDEFELPTIELATKQPGPVVVVTANVHGNEYTGVSAIIALNDCLADFLTKGKVLLYPSVNPRGLKSQSRNVPDDGQDLNRLFPGDTKGSPSARLAAALWRDISAHKPTVLIDLHADSVQCIPYSIIDRPVSMHTKARNTMWATLQRCAAATGLTVLHEYRDDEYLRYGLDRSLTGAMVNRAGVPAVTIEAGPRGAVDLAAVETQIRAVMGVLSELKMVSASESAHPTRVLGGPWRRAPTPRIRVAGMFFPLVPAGEKFESGECLGIIKGLTGTVVDSILARQRGVVVSWVDAGWVAAGSVPGTLGIIDE
jgi:uncharacterized protein